MIGRAGSIRMPILLVAVLIAFPGFFFVAWVNLYFHYKKISLLLPSLALALPSAYLFTTLLGTR